MFITVAAASADITQLIILIMYARFNILWVLYQCSVHLITFFFSISLLCLLTNRLSQYVMYWNLYLGKIVIKSFSHDHYILNCSFDNAFFIRSMKKVYLFA